MKKYRLFAVFVCLSLLAPLYAGALDTTISPTGDDPAPAATAVLLVDADYNTILYEKNAHEKRYPASITKVMTALLTLEAIDAGQLTMDTQVTATSAIHNDMAPDGTTQNIKTGEILTVKDLLYCVLLPSANEACNVLAIAVSGDIPSFIALMNTRAEELGMTGTHFANTHGLHKEDHYTTAYDIWLMSRKAMEHEAFREMVSTAEYFVPATNLSDQRHFYNTNALLSQLKYRGYVYKPAIGIKTGSTPEAGQCLVSAAVKDNRTLYCVLMGAELVKQPDESYTRMSFSESSRILEWGFQNFSYRTILDSSEPLDEISVTLSDGPNYVTIKPQGTLSAVLPNDLDVTVFQQTIIPAAESVQAPVTEGQVLGQVVLSYDGAEYGTLDLVASNDVARSELLYRMDQVQQFFSQTWVKLAVAALIILILVLIVRNMLRKKNKQRRSRSYVGSGGRHR